VTRAAAVCPFIDAISQNGLMRLLSHVNAANTLILPAIVFTHRLRQAALLARLGDSDRVWRLVAD
jgi:hypothetical protein